MFGGGGQMKIGLVDVVVEPDEPPPPDVRLQGIEDLAPQPRTLAAMVAMTAEETLGRMMPCSCSQGSGFSHPRPCPVKPKGADPTLTGGAPPLVELGGGTSESVVTTRLVRGVIGSLFPTPGRAPSPSAPPAIARSRAPSTRCGCP
jgi:hypothetical protein